MKNSSSVLKKVIAVVVAVIIAGVAFAAGYLTRGLLNGGNVNSYKWVMDTIGKYYMGEFDEDEAKDASLKSIAGLLDPYSEYYTKEEYKQVQDDNSGSKSGIGITYNFLEGKGALIITVMGNSPAYKSGLRSGDLLTGGSSDGSEVKFNTASDFNSFIDGFNTGERFTLKSEENTFELAKEHYTASYTFMATRNTCWEFTSSEDGGLGLVPGKDVKSYLPEGTAYLKLTQFYGTAGAEFGKLIEKFNAESCTSLILDLRNNGGGYVSVMQDIAGYFTSAISDKKSVAMTAKYKDGRESVDYCEKHSGNQLVPEGTEIYVLANSGTASASEALIGVLVSYGLLKYENIFLSDFSEEYLKYMGEGAKTKRSYGKGIMQSTFTNFFTGEALKLTTAKIYWPNGKCIHDVGLTEADGCRLAPAQWAATKGDEELKYVVSQL
ncbi:MAG: hypothetical protein HDP34_04515 [Clostridia bacterium]|nr:hypothetical protein [Clostridia bacterium]